MIGGRDFTQAMVDHVVNTQVRSHVPDVDSKPRVFQKLKQALQKV